MGNKCKLGRKRKYSNRKKGDHGKKIVRNVNATNDNDSDAGKSITTNFDENNCTTTNFDKTHPNISAISDSRERKQETTNAPENPPVIVADKGEFKKKEIVSYADHCEAIHDRTWEQDQYKRSAIAFVYTNHLFCPPQHEWWGKGGSIAKACDFLQLDYIRDRKTVSRVFLLLNLVCCHYGRIVP